MHLRGRSFRVGVKYPDGRRETLLNVPNYDFNWQVQYEFEEPMPIPAGSTIKDVRIPRFDREKRPAALLRARVLKIISEQKIRGEDIRVRVFSKKEEELLRVHMSTAEFDQSTGILKNKHILRNS